MAFLLVQPAVTVVEVELAGGSQYHMEKAPQREKERS